jgi:uncharacterized SAM-binding protein YcdF (DUF218 family)
MFFILSKILALLATPSNFIGVLFFIGLLLFALQWPAPAQRLVTVGIVLLMLFGFLPLGSLLLLPLTERFPAWSNHGGDPTGMIVLGGGDTAGRIVAIADLARRFPHSRVAVSGGGGFLLGPSEAEAPLIACLLESLGVPAQRIVIEDRSRNTAENAAFARHLLQPKAGERWLLVTSAQHMPRAVGCFQNAGFAVEPYPVQSTGSTGAAMSIPILSDRLGRTDEAVHEWLGLIVYWITGRTDELFPGPRE